MEEIQIVKSQIREEIAEKFAALSANEIAEKTKAIENRLFDFANFLESKITLLYVNNKHEVLTANILKRAYIYNKIVVLPVYNTENFEMELKKVDNLEKDLNPGPRDILQPDESRCKVVPIDKIDIAIIPAVALDEKGGRIGSGNGYYDRLIPRLAITTRKVALAFEEQIIPQVPIESHDKHVDIIITENRVIYKI
ncbi:MAG: 5-formyltetrahydrofolate cyclo-ligase [Desulfobacterales bacterium]|jgi:5-formyltetrahydrofolate cyclo-ligase|nr:5-formyltetrahydrofolate cyclo-ligase [Desulfobacterales bacterium]